MNRPDQSEQNKRRRFGVLPIVLSVVQVPFVLLNGHTAIVRKPMHIVINNVLPCID